MTVLALPTASPCCDPIYFRFAEPGEIPALIATGCWSRLEPLPTKQARSSVMLRWVGEGEPDCWHGRIGLPSPEALAWAREQAFRLDLEGRQ